VKDACGIKMNPEALLGMQHFGELVTYLDRTY
jgi:acyl carrier protein